MTKDEIVEQVILLLRQHARGLRGSIHQKAHKHDFFALFAEAYNAGMMSGSEGVLYADALRDLVVARAPDLAVGDVWEALRRFWSDWTYAWDHVAELHR